MKWGEKAENEFTNLWIGKIVGTGLFFTLNRRFLSEALNTKRICSDSNKIIHYFTKNRINLYDENLQMQNYKNLSFGFLIVTINIISEKF